jgi:hypothetical protein
MKRIIGEVLEMGGGVVLAVLLLLACIDAAHADAPDQFYDLNIELHRNFVPITENPHDEVLRLPNPHEIFVGDCDDYAGAGARGLYEQGFYPNFVVVKKRYNMGRHTIVCADDWCLDNDVPYPYHRNTLRHRYIDIIADIPIPARYLEREAD